MIVYFLLFSTNDDFSSKGDNEHHRHACDCPVLHNPLLYARCQNLNQCSAIIVEEFPQTFSAADLEPPAPGEEVDAEEPSAFAGVGKIMQVDVENTVGSDCCGRFSALPVSCGCSSWLEDLWGSSP